jgi:hypothetical protein
MGLLFERFINGSFCKRSYSHSADGEIRCLTVSESIYRRFDNRSRKYLLGGIEDGKYARTVNIPIFKKHVSKLEFSNIHPNQ